MGRWEDVMRSIRSMYVYTPVFLTALWMLVKGEMDPARNPRFKASSEAYGGGFPPMAWLNVTFVVIAWALLSVDVYVAYRDGAAAGMQFSIAAEGLMVRPVPDCGRRKCWRRLGRGAARRLPPPAISCAAPHARLCSQVCWITWAMNPVFIALQEHFCPPRRRVGDAEKDAFVL